MGAKAPEGRRWILGKGQDEEVPRERPVSNTGKTGKFVVDCVAYGETFAIKVKFNKGAFGGSKVDANGMLNSVVGQFTTSKHAKGQLNLNECGGHFESFKLSKG